MLYQTTGIMSAQGLGRSGSSVVSAPLDHRASSGNLKSGANNAAGQSPVKAQKPKFKSRYLLEVQAILFTAGDVRHPLQETAVYLEEAVHEHITSLLREALLAAARRGAKTFAAEDLLFYLRRDAARVSRLKEYLQWREVRRTAKPDDSASTPASVVTDPLMAGLDEEPASSTGADRQRRKPSYRMPWSLSSSIDHDLFLSAWQEQDDPLLDAIDGALPDTRLLRAAERTESMSREEYLDYTECRQSSSFTYKKMKKFREWLSPSSITDYRLGDDLIEMLGMLAWEAVFIISARAVKVAMDEATSVRQEDEDKISLFSIQLFAKPSAKRALGQGHIRASIDGLQLEGDPLFPPTPHSALSNKFPIPLYHRSC